MGHQVYSSLECHSLAIRFAILFSYPSPFWLENGRLSISAHTRRSPGVSGAGRWALAGTEKATNRRHATAAARHTYLRSRGMAGPSELGEQKRRRSEQQPGAVSHF